ncbi:MAG: NAD-binding protein, partial [Myxococcales bacterium]|nr:NAD-binding protein [Myxococcales bacterium]
MKPPRTSLGDPADYLEQRVYRALGAFSVVSALGSLGYYYLGQGQWAFWDCLYMTMVTVSTVGFSETLPGIEHVEGARAFTVLLILMGSGVLLYSASTVTAFVVEGDLVGILRRNRMQQKIDNLNGHIVVCGAGSTGSHVIEELHAMRAPFVVVDANEDRLRELDR